MCDTIAALRPATSAGTTLFGKNSDRDFLESQYLEFIPAARHEPGTQVKLTYKTIEQARKTNAVLLSKAQWMWGAEIGANAHGLMIGNEALFSKIPATMTGEILGMDYLRLALERAGEVDEAIALITSLLSRHGQGGNGMFKRVMAYHNSYLLADCRCAKVLETVDRDWVVRSFEDYYAISNAMTVESDFESSSPTLKVRAMAAGLYTSGAPFSFKAVFEDKAIAAGGEYRRQRAMRLLKERSGRLRPADLFGIFRDHVEGPSTNGRPGARICAHRKESPIGQTTASWVADLAPGRVVHWVTATAAPCTSLYKPVLFETGVPAHGPKPGADEDGRSLWWNHERLRRGLDQSTDEVRRAFTDERDSIEGRFLAVMVKCPAVVDSRSREEARLMVEGCWREALEFEFRWLVRLGS